MCYCSQVNIENKIVQSININYLQHVSLHMDKSLNKMILSYEAHICRL